MSPDPPRGPRSRRGRAGATVGRSSPAGWMWRPPR